MKTRSGLSWLLLMPLGLLASAAQAGGLWLNEYGTTAQGRAGAGAQAGTGGAEIVSAKNPPAIGYSGEYNTNEILFFSLAFNFPPGGVSR